MIETFGRPEEHRVESWLRSQVLEDDLPEELAEWGKRWSADIDREMLRQSAAAKLTPAEREAVGL
ncbi:MAG: hypothetical protein AAGE52_01605 [Myxococcota bacterium]